MHAITRKSNCVTCKDNYAWCPDGIRQWRISFVSAWLLEYPCQGWKYKLPVVRHQSHVVAVHGLVETQSASRHLVQGMSVVNDSANIPWSRLKLSVYFYQNRSTTSNMLFLCPWVRQLHLDQGCMSQIFILRQFSSENGSLLSLTGYNFLSTNVSSWPSTFSSAVKRSISIACVTKSLSAIVCRVCGWLAKNAPNISNTANKVRSVSWCEPHLILPLCVLLSVGAVFITCSKTKDDYSFIRKMGSKVKGRGPSAESRWKVCDSELIPSLCTNAPKPFLVLI